LGEKCLDEGKASSGGIIAQPIIIRKEIDLLEEGTMKARNILAAVAILAMSTAPMGSLEGNSLWSEEATLLQATAKARLSHSKMAPMGSREETISGYEADKRMQGFIRLSAQNPLIDGPLSEETISGYQADKRMPSPIRLSAHHPLTNPFFIENVGQFREGARFQVRGSSRTMWIAEDAIWFVVWEQGETRRGGAEEQGSRGAEEISPLHPSTLAPLLRSGRGGAPLRSLIEGEKGQSLATAIKLSFSGSNPNPKLEPFKRLETVISFFKGKDPSNWHTKVPAWGGVRYKELYPGVDLVLEGEAGRIKMRWEALPCAELEKLRMRVEGAREVSLEGGNLVLVTDVGEFSLRLPVLEGVEGRLEVEEIPGEDGAIAYEVSSPWAEEGETTAFQSADNPSDLLYGTFLGGVESLEPSPSQAGHAIAVGEDGSAYVTGYTNAVDFPTTPGAFDTSQNGSKDAFVAKLNPNGSSLSYGTFIGGSSGDYGSGIAVDGGGNAYVTGETWSSDFPTTPGAFDTSHNGWDDAFVVKLNPNGSSLSYGTFIGGSDYDSGRGIAIDGGGNAYVTGYTDSPDFPTTSGAFDTSLDGWADAFVVKLDPNGSSLVYGTFIGGSDGDKGWGIAVDGGGNAYVTGETGSSDFPITPGAFDTSHNWGDAFVVKLNPNGSSLFYGTFIGGSDYDSGYGIAVDGGGNAYVTGDAGSSDFPITPGAFDTSHNGSYDAFVVKLNQNGSSLIYGTFIGGSGWDEGYGIAVDGGGNAYVTGKTWSSDFPTTPGAFDTSHNGEDDAFVAKLNPNGSSLSYGTFIGGSGWDEGCGIAVDGGGNAYVTGETGSSDFPTTPGAFDRSINSYQDAFVVKLNQSGSSLSYGTFLGGEIGSFDYGHAIAVDDEGYAYVTGGTESSDFPTTPGAFDTSLDDDDAFVVKLNPNGSSLSYGTFIGGSDDDYGIGIAVDGGGNAYVTGYTRSSDFPTTPGAFDTSFNLGDAFVVKLDPNGSSLFYGTFIGGSSGDSGGEIAVDGEGNAYVTGSTYSSDFPTTPGVFDTSYNGGWTDAFVVKLNQNGSSLSYSTFIGGIGWDSGGGIAVDGGGNAYVTGYTDSPDFPTTHGAFDTSYNGDREAFVVKLNPNGSSLSYGTFIGGSFWDYGRGIAVDVGGNAYVTGETWSSDFPTTPGAFDTSHNGKDDAFVVKLNQNGSSLSYGTFIGGSDDDFGSGIAVDVGGNAYVTGWTWSSDFPTTPGAFDTSYNWKDAFVVKLNPNGSSLSYGTFIGGSHGDYGRGIAVDGGGNAYVTGYTYSSDFPITPGAFDTTCEDCPAYHDAFVVKLWVGGVVSRVYLPIVLKEW
jgi:hypothetical protein